MLHRAGQIELPAVRFRPPESPWWRRERLQLVLIDMTPLTGALSDICPESCNRSKNPDEPLFNSLMEEHHYLGYEQPVGEHLKYLVWAIKAGSIACLAWSSAPRHAWAAATFI